MLTVETPAPLPDRRVRPRGESVRNAALVAAGVALAAAGCISQAGRIKDAAACTADGSRLTAAQSRYRSDVGKFGSVPQLIDKGLLDRAPANLVVSLSGSGDTTLRVIGIEACEGFEFIQDDPLQQS